MPHRNLHPGPAVKHQPPQKKTPEPVTPKAEEPKKVEEVTPAPAAVPEKPKAVTVTPTQVRDMVINMDESTWRKIKEQLLRALAV